MFFFPFFFSFFFLFFPQTLIHYGLYIMMFIHYMMVIHYNMFYFMFCEINSSILVYLYLPHMRLWFV